MEASLRRHDWLNGWPLVAELNLQPLSPPWRSGVGDKGGRGVGGKTESSNSSHMAGSNDN